MLLDFCLFLKKILVVFTHAKHHLWYRMVGSCLQHVVALIGFCSSTVWFLGCSWWLLGPSQRDHLQGPSFNVSHLPSPAPFEAPIISVA